jgi:hypothetical protein
MVVRTLPEAHRRSHARRGTEAPCNIVSYLLYRSDGFYITGSMSPCSPIRRQLADLVAHLLDVLVVAFPVGAPCSPHA